ncbi:uncharacterized protein LOC103573765 [Microplitis demolitor]|uniref:uncharacterized protein LOC103573765 n=1 Tax=Microplitis demolitor TaxID=69319 RepID=UPI0004CD30F8|nr:uncharacterized protein LOC103573765 [Microplitis demolitor]XP_053592871.1 uncharacterized protein LOC103573765 [Microplitis demolitor]
MGNIINKCYVPNIWAESYSYFEMFEDLSRQVKMCAPSSSSPSSFKNEDMMDHIFTIFGRHPTTLGMTDDGVWIFQLPGAKTSDEPSQQLYRLIHEKAVRFLRHQAIRHLSLPAPPQNLSKTLSDDDDLFPMGEPLAYLTLILSSSSSLSSSSAAAEAASASSQSSGYPESFRLSAVNVSISESEQLQQNAQSINELLHIREQQYQEILQLQQQQFEQACIIQNQDLKVWL